MAGLEREKQALLSNLFQYQTERRVLRNTIQTLKGTVRVVLRIKPKTTLEQQPYSLRTRKGTITRLAKNTSTELSPTQEIFTVAEDETSVALFDCRRQQEHRFTFNRVFDGTATQAAVFDEVSQFVTSALDGSNVCLFSYGQTGSGKTHTMTGDLAEPASHGITPRAIELIFDHMREMESQGYAVCICLFLCSCLMVVL